MEPTTADLKRLVGRAPAAVKFLATIIASILIPLALGLVGYGEIKGRQDETQKFDTIQIEELKKRVERLEDSRADDRKEMNDAILVLQTALGNVRLDYARICQRVRCKE